MKWLVIALVVAAATIGVETYLLLKPAPPVQTPLPAAPHVAAVTPPVQGVPTVRPRPKARRRPARATSQPPADAPWLKGFTNGSQRPFVMPTGGIFSGADPQDPRIYHFAAQ